MRNTFVTELELMAESDPSLILLVGDIGFGVFENFAARFPKQYINVGIAEQNMISVAAGLAKEGYKPIVYTIIPFLTMRAFEQIRVDISMHNRNVKLVGVGGGFSYDVLGPTHHALEDLGIMRALPNMQILTPSTPRQIRTFLASEFAKNGPSYLRLGKNGEPDFEENGDRIELAKGISIHLQGDDVTLLTHGPILSEVIEAGNKLKGIGITSNVVSIFRNEKFDFSHILQNPIKSKYLVMIEENYRTGSLYSELLDYLATNNIQIKVLGLHPAKGFYTRVAKRSEILADLKLDSECIFLSVKSFLGTSLD